MYFRSQWFRLSGLVALLFVVAAGTFVDSSAAFGQKTQTDSLRGANYVYPRPSKQARASAPRAKYKRKTTSLPESEAMDSRIGVTFWRARPAVSRGLLATRDIVQANGETKAWTLARLGSEPELGSGEQFRIGIETLQSGYLYVINRSVRASGNAATPYLIFPTRRIRGGDNRIGAGRMAMIPTPPDEPPFEIRDASGDLLREEIIILISPKPLDIETRDDRYALDAAQVEDWIARWSAPSEAFELAGGEGTLYTIAEKSAATDPAYLLTMSDPMPQIVHRIAAKPGAPLVLRMAVRVRQGAARR